MLLVGTGFPGLTNGLRGRPGLLFKTVTMYLLLNYHKTHLLSHQQTDRIASMAGF